MDLLIKGMELPEFGEKIIVLTSSGYVEDVSGQVIQGVEAVELPPHGRCIDVDALIKSLSLDENDVENGASLLMAIFIEVLKAAPTIIEAEEEK